jgi:hypothetical protein
MSSSSPKKSLSQDIQLIRQLARLVELYPQYTLPLIVHLSCGNEYDAAWEWFRATAETIWKAGDPADFLAGWRDDVGPIVRAL